MANVPTPLPAAGSTSWYQHYADLDAGVRASQTVAEADATYAPAEQPLLAAAQRSVSLPGGRAVGRAVQAGHGWTAGFTDDTAVKMLGDLSARYVTNGSGGSLYVGPPAFGTPQDWSKHVIRVFLRVDYPGRLQTAQVYVTTGAGNTFTASIPGPPQSLVAGTWQVFTIPRSAFSVAVGAPVWTGVTKIEFRFQDKGGAAPITVWTHGFDVVPDYAHLYPNGVFILEADDGYASHKSLLLPLAESLGVPVTMPLTIERITDGGAGMSVADLKAFVRNGHHVACHAFTNAFHGNAAATATDLEADLAAQQKWYADQGIPVGGYDLACCPGTGSPVSDPAKMEVLRRRFRSVRTSEGYYETVVPGDAHRLRSILFTGNTNSQLQVNIDQAASPGGVLILALHEVVTGATNGTASSLPAIAVDNLRTVLQYAASKGMVFRTRADLMERR